MANKYTPQSERAAIVGVAAVWNGAGAAPDAATVSCSFTRKLIHDDAPDDVVELSAGGISFDGLRTDRSVQVGGGPVLTYRQCTLYLLQMIGHMRSNPDPS